MADGVDAVRTSLASLPVDSNAVDPARIVETDRNHVEGCESLGDFAPSVTMRRAVWSAKADVLRLAGAAGATHIVWDDAPSMIVGRGYRCR